MKKILIFTLLSTSIILLNNKILFSSHCSGEFSGTDITNNVVCDGIINTVSGNCTGECYDYFDIELEAGESITLSACSNGANIPDPTFDIFFSIWTNSPTFDTQVACSDSPTGFITQSFCSGDFGDDSQGTEVVFTATVSGIYRIEISDWFGGFNDGNYTIAVGCPGEIIEPTNDIPTLSEWGLILLALLLMSYGSVKLAVLNPAFSNTETQLISISGNKFQLPFNQTVFNYAILLTVFLVILGFFACFLLFNKIFMSDIIGVAFTAPVFTYLIHLLYLLEKKK